MVSFSGLWGPARLAGSWAVCGFIFQIYQDCADPFPHTFPPSNMSGGGRGDGGRGAGRLGSVRSGRLQLRAAGQCPGGGTLRPEPQSRERRGVGENAGLKRPICSFGVLEIFVFCG